MTSRLFVYRALSIAAVSALLASCSSTTSGVTPTVAALQSIAATGASQTRSQQAERFEAAARRAPFTFAQFRGARAAYLEELDRGGYLAPAPHKAAWLDRAAYESAIGIAGTTKRFDSTATTAPTSTPTRDVVFAVNEYQATIDIYANDANEPQDQNQPMIGQIALPTYGTAIAVAPSHHIYIGAGRNVYEYTPKSLPNPIRTIALPHSAEGIAVAPNGTIYATDFFAYEASTPAIFVVAPGATAPTSTISDPQINNGFNAVSDSQGDIFLTYTKAPADSVHPQGLGEIAAGSSTFASITVPDNPGDVQIDTSGNLVLASGNGSAQTATLDIFPSGSTTISKSVIIETKFDYLNLDHKPANNRLYFVEQNVGTSSADGQLFEFKYPGGVQLDAIDNGNIYFSVATDPTGTYGQPWTPPANQPSPGPTATATAPPAPAPSASATSCQNGTDGPILDASNDKLYFGGSTICTGSGGYNGFNGVSTTATLYNAISGAEISYFTFAATQSSHAERKNISCPFAGSYYVTVTSNAAPAVTSSTVQATKNQNGEPTC